MPEILVRILRIPLSTSPFFGSIVRTSVVGVRLLSGALSPAPSCGEELLDPNAISFGVSFTIMLLYNILAFMSNMFVLAFYQG